jgi:colanic acid/amylovoran biosynthesis protein
VDSDIEALVQLLDESVGDEKMRRLQTPLDVIHRTSACRLVVTGSYHAGVFALAQGIPVVAIAASNYYRDKFLGLADPFGGGCRVLMTQEPQFASQLDQAIEGTWKQAPALRPDLLRAAEAQIAAAQAAYRQVPALLTSKV